MKKRDLRVERTRYMLKNALIELLEERNIESITVHMLSERAMINRVTFYSHYKDLTNMLEQLATETIKTAREKLTDANNDIRNWDKLINFLKHVQEENQLYKLILVYNKLPGFRNEILKVIETEIYNGIERSTNTKHKDIKLWYDSSAIIGTIICWLKEDMPYTPKYLVEKIAEIHLNKL
ncbi:MAG TPA: TetR-like C-terminal domain-containing protein [Staphylococcus sp.]|nr:TetR-like C-terminal domain-containing protein [Staphylococcus sp.]